MTLRNRANAEKSTGPRSAAGKARASQNARRHGATARPDPARVVRWVKVILDAPDLAPSALLEPDERTRQALALATAEVQLADCERALRDDNLAKALMPVTAVTIESSSVNRMYDAIEIPKSRVSENIEPPESMQFYRKAIATLKKDLPERYRVEYPKAQKRETLLARYLREAQTGRSRALRAWVEGERKRSLPASENSNFPKRSQFQL